MGDPLPAIFIRGSGFTDVSGIQVGDAWVEDYRVDGDSIITITLPHLTPGTTNWVVVYVGDEASPCEGEAQLLTVDDLLDVPAGDLSVTGMEPSTIAVGREESYWLLGTGLSRVRYAVIGSSACAVESYDDNRLIVRVPADCDGVVEGATVTLKVFSPTEDASLTVTCHGPAPEPTTGPFWPGIFSIEPDRLGVGGGEVVVTGYRLTDVIALYVDTIECAVHDVQEDRLRATVPSLEGREGTRLSISVTDGTWASPHTEAHLTVEG
jgi:IPT/TIG domain